MSVYNRVEVGERPDDSRWATATNSWHFPWRAECDEKPIVKNGIPCQFREVAYTEAHAQHMLDTHTHLIYDSRRSQYLSLAELLWIELDSVVDQIMASPKEEGLIDTERLKLQGRATGLAFAITRICVPYYADETAVSRESMKRWKIRNKQQDWEPTPGFKYDPPIPGMAPQVQYAGPEGPAPTFTKSKVDKERATLKNGQEEQIKHAIGTGMFKPADLAKVYKVSEETISVIAKS